MDSLRQRRFLDVVLAAAVVATMWLGSVVVARTSDTHGFDVVAGVLLGLAGATLIWRQQRPRVTAGVVAALVIVYDLLDRPGAFATLALGVAVVTTVAAGHRLFAVGVVAAVLATLVGVDVVEPVGQVVTGTSALWFAGWMTLAVVVGEVVRSRRGELAAVRERAREAERTREEAARRRAADERVRIAREVHDSVGHHLSMIHLRADVALQLLDEQPQQASDALAVIRDGSRAGLDELRSTLGMLAHEDPPRRPSPTLSDIDGLVNELRAAGVAVDLRIETEAVTAAGAAEGRAAFLVAREALTNVVRHASPPHATVHLGCDDGQLHLVVGNPVTKAPMTPTSRSSGLDGMRERVEALDGTFRLHTRDGWFEIDARLPMSPSA